MKQQQQSTRPINDQCLVISESSHVTLFSVVTHPFTRQQMTMLERRQRNELEALSERAKAEKQALNRNMEMMREAGMKREWQYQQQVNAAAKRERHANQALQGMRQAYRDERQKVLDQKAAFDWEKQFLVQQSGNTQRQMQSQLNTLRERERQQNEAFFNLTQQRQNDRRELESMRSETESLQFQLAEANKPGFFRSIWKKLF